jgi:hypothetical protein
VRETLCELLSRGCGSILVLIFGCVVHSFLTSRCFGGRSFGCELRSLGEWGSSLDGFTNFISMYRKVFLRLFMLLGSIYQPVAFMSKNLAKIVVVWF